MCTCLANKADSDSDTYIDFEWQVGRNEEKYGAAHDWSQQFKCNF